MALLGNYSVLQKIPSRFRAGTTTSVENGIRSNYKTSGTRRNFTLQSMASTAKATVAFPTGYYPPYTWMLPEVAGELGTTPQAIVGSVSLTSSNLAGGLYGVSSISGSGDVTAAALALIAGLISNITGTGDVTGASPTGALGATCSLTGTGSVSSADLGALASMLAPLTGSGGVTAAVPTAPADLSADIKSYGDLTPQGLSDAVWSAILESGLTANQLMRIISSALAGKVSGAEGTTVVFRDVGDTTDRITATVDSSGNRTAITYDVN